MDNTNAHQLDYEALCPNIKVLFLPPTLLLQPMDQGVMTKFRAYYLQRTFFMLIKETAGEGKPSVKEFCKSYNLLNGVGNTHAAWKMVTSQCRNGVWHHAWLDAVHSFLGFDAIPALEQEIVKLAKDVGLAEVEDDVQELLDSHNEQLTNEELIELDQQWLSEESKADDDDDVGQDDKESLPFIWIAG
nr:tigger transposable element-derived protein 1-like [Chrysemys picta bellii]